MKMRKPPIYLLIILPILVGGSIFFISELIAYYAASKGIPPSAIPFAAGMLIALSALFLWIPLSLLLSNIILTLVPPLRKIAESYAGKSGHPDFWKSQTRLFLVLVALGIICVPVIIYGFLR